jgi:hypothetical protein
MMTLNRRLKVDDLFDGLGSEDEHSIRRFKLSDVESDGVKRIREGFEKYSEIKSRFQLKDVKIDQDPLYSIAKILLPKEYTSGDVTEFSLRDCENFGWNDGYFFSALFDNSLENRFRVSLGKSMYGVGYRNNGNDITIIGDVEDDLGKNMQSGRIYVEGNVRSNVGEEMTGGEIMIKGNAIHDVGIKMQDGKIKVNGNVGNSLGAYMNGGIIIVDGNAGTLVGRYNPEKHPNQRKEGIIHVDGDIHSLGDKIICKEIYHQGKLIVNDGGKLL